MGIPLQTVGPSDEHSNIRTFVYGLRNRQEVKVSGSFGIAQKDLSGGVNIVCLHDKTDFSFFVFEPRIDNLTKDLSKTWMPISVASFVKTSYSFQNRHVPI